MCHQHIFDDITLSSVLARFPIPLEKAAHDSFALSETI